MKGKNVFTKEEAQEIERLINEKVISSRDKQKRIRDRIRAIGLYYSDFSSKKEYTVEDFKELISKGRIKIQ